MADDSRFSIDFTGMEALNAKLAELAATSLAKAGAALRAEAEIEMTEAKRRTPVDTGALRASGHVEGPMADTTSLVAFDVETKVPTFGGESARGGEVSVRLVFGGPAANYAVIVHYDLDAFHPVGQALYLSSVLEESAPHLAARVAARMAL